MNNSFLYRFKGAILLSTFFILLTVIWMSCGSPSKNSNPVSAEQQTVLSLNNPQIKALVPVQEKYTPSLMKQDGVIGTAIGLDTNGKPAILVLTETDIQSQALAKGRILPIPAKLGNVPTVQFVSGVIRTMQLLKGKPGGGGKPSPGVSHTAKQSTPIELGTSGGWEYDIANGYCCSGTLGSLITNGSKLYILSNFHVLYGDIESGNNGIIAGQQGYTAVIQPGLVDVNCSASNAQVVANLISGGGSFTATNQDANVDAGIAQIISGMVNTSGAILEIGTISSSTVDASLNQSVKKSGRTTGLTTSKVIGLNATVSVSYETECGGTTAFTKTYSGQIIISNKGSKFLNSGDSGSLMVENVSNNPRAVGLLFAGSSTAAVANPINDVLDYYSNKLGGKFTMVGK